MSSKKALDPIPSAITPDMLEPGEYINLDTWFPKDKYVLAVPNKIINEIPAGHKLKIGFRKVNAKLVGDYEKKAGNKDVYPTPKATGRVSLKSVTVIEIGQINGVSWFPPDFSRERGKNNELLSVYAKAVGQYADYTGSRKFISDSKTIDFTVLKQNTKMTEGNIQTKMTHGVEQAVTGAQARAVRKEFNIQASYHPDEIHGKLFVGISLQLDMDYNDPRVQQLLLQAAVQPRMLLYGGQDSGGAVEADYTVEDEPPARTKPSAKTNTDKPRTSKPKGGADLQEIKADIVTLCQKLDKKPPQPLDEMSEPNLKGFLQYLRNEEARHA